MRSPNSSALSQLTRDLSGLGFVNLQNGQVFTTMLAKVIKPFQQCPCELSSSWLELCTRPYTSPREGFHEFDIHIGGSKKNVNNDTNSLNHGTVWKIQSFFERNLSCHPLAGLLWQGQLEKNRWEHGWELTGNACSCTHRKGYSYLCGWHQVCWTEKKYQSDVESSQRSRLWENQHHWLMMSTLGCTQWHFETRKHIVDKNRAMFASRISTGATDKLQCLENPNISS